MGLGLLWSYLVNDSDERIGCVISNDSVLYRIVKTRTGFSVTDLKKNNEGRTVKTIAEAVNNIFGKDRGMIAFMLGRDGLLVPSKYAGCTSNIIKNTNYKKNTINSKEYFWGYVGDRAIVLSIVENEVVYQLLEKEELLHRRRDRYYNIVYTENTVQLRDKKMRKFGTNGLPVFPPYMSLKCVAGIRCNVVEKIDEGVFKQFTIGAETGYDSKYIRSVESGEKITPRYSLLKRYGQFGKYAGIVAFVDYIYNTDKADLQGYSDMTYTDLCNGLGAMRFMVKRKKDNCVVSGDKNKLLNLLVLEDYKTKILEPFVHNVKGFCVNTEAYTDFIDTMYSNVESNSRVIDKGKPVVKVSDGVMMQIETMQQEVTNMHHYFYDKVTEVWQKIDYDNLEYNVQRFFREYYKLAQVYAWSDIKLAYKLVAEVMNLPIAVQVGVVDCLIADRYTQEKLSITGMLKVYNSESKTDSLIQKAIASITKQTALLKAGTVTSVKTDKGIVQINALGYLMLTLLQINTPILIAQSGTTLLEEYRYNFINAWRYVAVNQEKPDSALNHDLLTLLDYYKGDTYAEKLMTLVDVGLLRWGNNYLETMVHLQEIFKRKLDITVPLHYFMMTKVKVNKKMGICQYDKAYLSRNIKKVKISGHKQFDSMRYDVGLKIMTNIVVSKYRFIIIKMLYDMQGTAVTLTPMEAERELKSICHDIASKFGNAWLWTFCIQAKKYLLTPPIKVNGRYGAYLTDIASIPYRQGYKAKVFNAKSIHKAEYRRDDVTVLRQRVECSKIQPIYTVDDLKKIQAAKFNENTEIFLTSVMAAILRRTNKM